MDKLSLQTRRKGSYSSAVELPEESGATSENAKDQTVNKSNQGVGLTPLLCLVAAVGTLGNSVPTGYNLGVINMPQEVLKAFVNETKAWRGVILNESDLDNIWSVVVSAFLAGAMVGSLFAGYLATKLGRKGAMFLNCLVGLISSVLFGLSGILFSVEALVLARILAGFCGGLGSSVAPLYLMETAPPTLRGAFGVMQQLGLTVGILISQILGLKSVLGTEELWPLLLSLYGVGMIFGMVTLVFCPNSPSFLYVNKQQEDQALKELERLRGVSLCYLQEEVLLLKKEKKHFETCPEWSLLRVLKSADLRMPLMIICALHAAQQISGISAVFYYSTGMFAKTGMSSEQSAYGSIGTGMANAFMACLAVPLVNNVRRRRLLGASSLGAILCLLALTVSMITQQMATWVPYVTVTTVLLFVLIFGLGMGPLPFMLGSELLPQGPRAAGMGLGCLVNWLTNFLVAMVFPYLQNILEEYVFLFFAAPTLVLSVFLWIYLPESKGLDSTQVTAIFQSRRNKNQVLATAVDEEDQCFVAIV